MKVKLTLKPGKFDNRRPFNFTFGQNCRVTYWSVSKKQAINRFLSEIGTGIPFKLDDNHA